MEKINLTGVPETMIQTLFARAKESKKNRHFIYDAKAVEIVSCLDYDFSLAEKDALMSDGVIARTILLDRMVGSFIQEHQNATIINIACGLDTRFYRLDNKKIRWYNIDLPETISVRKNFFTETERVKMIARSAMDASWTEDIETDSGGCVLVVVEGLSMYLSGEDIIKMLQIINKGFSNVTIYMEYMSPFVVRHIKERSIEGSNAKFSWGCKSGKELAGLNTNFILKKDVSLIEGMKAMYPIYRFIGWIPFVKNFSNRIAVLEKYQAKL